jgi:hypothetical protein
MQCTHVRASAVLCVCVQLAGGVTPSNKQVRRGSAVLRARVRCVCKPRGVCGVRAGSAAREKASHALWEVGRCSGVNTQMHAHYSYTHMHILTCVLADTPVFLLVLTRCSRVGFSV